MKRHGRREKNSRAAVGETILDAARRPGRVRRAVCPLPAVPLVVLLIFHVFWNFATASLLPLAVEKRGDVTEKVRQAFRMSWKLKKRWAAPLAAQLLLLGSVVYVSVDYEKVETYEPPGDSMELGISVHRPRTRQTRPAPRGPGARPAFTAGLTAQGTAMGPPLLVPRSRLSSSSSFSLEHRMHRSPLRLFPFSGRCGSASEPWPSEPQISPST